MKDEASAKAAAPKLREYAQQIEQLASRKNTLSKIPAADGERILRTHTPKIKPLEDRLASAAASFPESARNEPSFQKAVEQLLESAKKMTSQ